MIKVAYDISFLVRHYRRFNFVKAGIFRVIESLMKEMQRENCNIDLTITAACNDKIFESFLGYILYTQDNLHIQELDYHSAFKSRLDCIQEYSVFYNFLYSDYFRPNSNTIPFLLRGIRKVFLKPLSLLSEFDISPVVDINDCDIFHSTYLKLPQKSITKNIMRSITIYDLIPVIKPEFVIKELEVFFKDILSSIDIERDWSICISEYTKQEFCEYTKMSEDRAFVTYLAPEEHFKAVSDKNVIQFIREKYKIPEGPYFLTIAAMQPRKNIAFLIESFYELISETTRIDHNLILVGSSGWMSDSINDAVNQRPDLKHRVYFTGYVQDDDLAAIYSDATAFVFPSLYEGFGLPILEAMQCGTPVISSNTTSLPEVAGDAAILINPQEQDELCQAMLNLLSDETLRDNLTQKGIERAKQFSWAKCAAETVEIYKKIAR